MSTAPQWFKSGYSHTGGGQCLEVAVAWRKSTYSSDEGDACVEVATCKDTVHVRDSKVPHGPVLDLTPAAWAGLAQWVSG